MLLDKNQIGVSSKQVIKQWRQLATSNSALAQELLVNVQGKGDENPKNVKHSDQRLEADNDQLGAITEADLTAQEAAQELKHSCIL